MLIREQESLFASALIVAGFVKIKILFERADQLIPADPLARRSLEQWLESVAGTHA